jgi:hypothetical protein
MVRVVLGDQFREQVADFVDCQHDQVAGVLGRVGSFALGDDDEDGVGERGEGGVAVPGGPLADLVLIEADFVFAGAEPFLDAPSTSRSPAGLLA